MRDIKFRAFVRGYIVEVKSIDFENNYITWFDGQYDRCLPPNKCYEIESLEDAKLMQFTGLHDRQGKEIYEGDILSIKWKVEVFRHPKTGAWMIRFHNNSGRNKPKTLYDYLRGRELAGTSDVDNAIIGNIYENPELIKSNK